MSRTHRRTTPTALLPLALTAAGLAAPAYPTDADGTVVADAATTAATTLTVAPGAPVPPPESSPDGGGGQE